MSLDRRTFLKTSALVGTAVGLGALPTDVFGADGVRVTAYRPETGDAQPKPLRILILGGTGFIGPYQVQYALDRKHKVTLFNRGKTNSTLFPKVPRLIGDRNLPDGHDALKKGTWDVVIDNPTANPTWVRGAGQALKGRVGQYLFVSTISVFSDNSKPVDENGPLNTPSDIDAPYNAQAYGSNKVRSEMEAKTQFGDNVTIVRPGLIVGPGDLSDRFSYWPVRIDKGGEILAPGNPNDPVQYVDALDLSQWIVRLGEAHTLGTFNATGPKSPTTIAEMLYGIKAVTTSDAKFTWVPAEFLAEKQVRAWSDMPVWVPSTGRTAGFSRVICQKANDAGLTFRPLADTAKDTLTWYHSRPAAEQEKARAGLAADKEKTVLAEWHAKSGK
ncbi:MAG: twin-arginine translocation signal domain-containing protein [Gemmatimonadaceae bacterium]|nr:twin-arginine translocation signal domain-containing protein [Gemmatimonadaceae bacterium]MCC6431937.1 twin-arginine translocation signal domain-containing protein [Gemmatimonadaceae bacterium]